MTLRCRRPQCLKFWCWSDKTLTLDTHVSLITEDITWNLGHNYVHNKKKDHIQSSEITLSLQELCPFLTYYFFFFTIQYMQ